MGIQACAFPVSLLTFCKLWINHLKTNGKLQRTFLGAYHSFTVNNIWAKDLLRLFLFSFIVSVTCSSCHALNREKIL